MRDGRVRGVETTTEMIEADDVVVAAGLWSRALLAAVDIHLAQWACEHFYVIADVTPRLPRETPSFVAPEDLLYGREEVGGMMVGAFDEDAKTIDAALAAGALRLHAVSAGLGQDRALLREGRRDLPDVWRRRRSAASSTGRSHSRRTTCR